MYSQAECPDKPRSILKVQAVLIKSNYNKHTQFYLIQKVKQFKHPRAPSPLSQYPGSPGSYPRVLIPHPQALRAPVSCPRAPRTLGSCPRAPRVLIPASESPVPAPRRLSLDPGLSLVPGLPCSLSPTPGLPSPLPHLPGLPATLAPISSYFLFLTQFLTLSALVFVGLLLLLFKLYTNKSVQFYTLVKILYTL